MEANASRQTATDWSQGIMSVSLSAFNGDNVLLMRDQCCFCLDSIIPYPFPEYLFKYFIWKFKQQ